MYWQVKTDHFWWAGLMETEGNAWLGLLPWGMLGWAATGLQLVPSSHPLSILAQQGHCTWGSPFLMALELLGCQGWGNQFGLEGWRAGETLWDSQHAGCFYRVERMFSPIPPSFLTSAHCKASLTTTARTTCWVIITFTVFTHFNLVYN